MTSQQHFDVGDLVRVEARFYDPDGNPINPGTVKFRALSPTGVQTDYDDPENPEIGVFYADVDIDEGGGMWRVRAEGTSPAQSAEEVRFRVPVTLFTLT